MTFMGSDPPSGTGKSNTWLTPLPLIKSLGDFDLDPCAHPTHKTATNLICLPDDGLSKEWTGRVWLNPPYGNQAIHWLNKMNQHGNGIAIVFNRLDTKWLLPFTAQGFFAMTGRVQFIPTISEIRVTQPGVGSLLIPFGKQNVTAIKRSGIAGAWFKMKYAKGK